MSGETGSNPVDDKIRQAAIGRLLDAGSQAVEAVGGDGYLKASMDYGLRVGLLVNVVCIQTEDGNLNVGLQQLERDTDEEGQDLLRSLDAPTMLYFPSTTSPAQLSEGDHEDKSMLASLLDDADLRPIKGMDDPDIGVWQYSHAATRLRIHMGVRAVNASMDVQDVKTERLRVAVVDLEKRVRAETTPSQKTGFRAWFAKMFR
jgi:hypothetical protein